MSTLTTAWAYRTLKNTLDNILTDKTDNVTADLSCTKYMQEETMADNWVEDAEVGGPGLLSERSEGQALEVTTLYEGPATRYIARKFGGILQVTEELEEDGKYNAQYVDAARRLKRALYKTLDVDCANILNRATNSSYVGGDGQPLASASHTIPGSGTYSNTLSTAMSPSRTALQTIATNAMLLPGHDGIVSGYKIKAIVCPIQQIFTWEGILGSEKVPESGNNEINVMYGKGIKVIGVPYWTATSTAYMAITDADDGLKLKWRRKPKARTWYDEDVEIIKHGISARWARGWSNPRAIYFSNA